MDPNDTQPGGQPNRTITIQLTRDTLVLIAALAFLAIAILLMIFFPNGSAGSQLPGGTGVAQASTAAPAAGRQPTLAVPVVGTSGEPTRTPAPGSTSAAPPLDSSYPVPPAETGSQPAEAAGGTAQQNSTTPEVADEPDEDTDSAESGSTEIPVFSPSRPTQPSLAVTDSFAAAQASAYPPPAFTTPTATFGSAGPPTATRATAQPTLAPLFQEPSATVAPTAAPPQPTSPPAVVATRRPPTPRPTPAPTAIPIDVLRGNIRWTASQSPIFLRRDQQLTAGSTLIIDPGVEVRIAPGVSFFVDGTLYAVGKPGQPVRFLGLGQRWEGLFGRPGSNIALENAEVRGGGAGGTVIASEGGNLVLHNARVNDNGGHIQVSDSRLEMRDSEIAGNDMPYGSALEASYTGGNGVILTGNRIGGNRTQPGTSPVQINNQSAFDTINLDIQRNLLVGDQGPDLVLSTNGPLQGNLACNALIGGTNGLSIRSETPQVPGFALNVHDNATERHTPPIIPEYLKYGIGRGATSEIALDMRNNWWGSPLGPYEPDRHADGRGEAVGDNIEFSPWLTQRPACAPTQ